MPLKYETVTTRLVGYSDLERFIKECTGHYYEIAPYEEWDNDSQHVIDVDLDDWDDDYQEDYETFKRTGECKNWLLQAIMLGLCRDGLLEAGVYTVEISW